MSIWKCNACGGTYNDLNRDGSIYMHACSPTPANAQGVQTELPNKRDENIALDAEKRPHGIISVGAGVTPMQGQTTSDPPWIVQLRTQAAALAISPPPAV